MSCWSGLGCFFKLPLSPALTGHLQATYTAVADKLAAFGTVNNPYTDLTPTLLQDRHGQLIAALKARRTQFEEELERQLDDDGVCDEFGELANPLLRHINTSMSGLTRPKVCCMLLVPADSLIRSLTWQATKRHT
jgi:hypothetical protein